MNARYLTDGGLETDLIFHHGVDLPEFAAFPLLETDEGRALLTRYYADYVGLAARAGVSLLLETPTWRANPDHAAALGYSAADLDEVNRGAVDFLRALDTGDVPRVIGGVLGPRGDGYASAGPVDPAQAADYHRPQLAAFAAAGADRATALTLTEVGEAIGIVTAAAVVEIPIAVGFTVETDGRLPDGTTLAEAIATVDAATAGSAAYFVVNCAHPLHIAAGLEPGGWTARVRGLRVNASTMSHAELDQAEGLDDGDPAQLAADQLALLDVFDIEVLGGCCGTDARHVAAMWGLSD